MRVVCVTPTGERPEAFALCERYMQRQTYRDFAWIVLDDGTVPTIVSEPCTAYVRPEWRWKPGDNTQAPNMIRLIDAALAVGFDLLLVIEDDEWYSPRYVERMVEVGSHGWDMFGQADARFYNVRLRHARQLVNREHTALCRSGMNVAGAMTMRQSFVDGAPRGIHEDRMMFERTAPDRKLIFELPTALNIGMKGMPGRGGIGTGHDRIKRGIVDLKMNLLREWVGSDAATYAQYYGRKRR